MTAPLITPTPDDFLAAFDAMPGYRWLALRNAINERDLASVGALIVAMLDDSATTPTQELQRIVDAAREQV